MRLPSPDRCRRTSDLVDVVLSEGDLTADERAHVADCPACARALADARAFERELSRVGHAAAPEALPVAPTLRSALDQELREKTVVRPPRIGLVIAVGGAAMAIASIFLLQIPRDPWAASSSVSGASASSPALVSAPATTPQPTISPIAVAPRPVGTLPPGHPLDDPQALMDDISAALQAPYPDQFSAWTLDGGIYRSTSASGDGVDVLVCRSGSGVSGVFVDDVSARFPFQGEPDRPQPWLIVAQQTVPEDDRAELMAFLLGAARSQWESEAPQEDLPPVALSRQIGQVTVEVQLSGSGAMVGIRPPDGSC